MIIADEIFKIIAVQLGVNEQSLTFQTSFVDDLQADSLDLIEVLMEVEEVFGIDVPDEVLDELVTIDDLIKHVERVTT